MKDYLDVHNEVECVRPPDALTPKERLLILDLCIDIIDGICWIDHDDDCPADQSLDKDLCLLTVNAKHQ